MVIAIDGPAGSGKSTIARILAEKLSTLDGKKFTYINSGNIYRALCLGCLGNGISMEDPEKILEYAEKARIEYRETQDPSNPLAPSKALVFLNGENVEMLLHSDEIDRHTAPLSTIIPVR